MAKNILKTVQGIDISVDGESGKFSAKIAGRVVEKTKLRDLEKMIDETSAAVIAYEIDSNYPRSPRKLEIARFEGDRAREKSGRLLARYDSFYILGPEEILDLEKIAEEYRRVKHEFENYVRGLPRLLPKNFEEIRKIQSGEDEDS